MSTTRPKRFTNWYLREWLRHLQVTQTEIGTRAGIDKAVMSLLVNDKQDYNPIYVRDIAMAMNIAPFELFMHPDDAASLKRLRTTAVQAVESGKVFDQPEERPGKTGTNG